MVGSTDGRLEGGLVVGKFVGIIELLKVGNPVGDQLGAVDGCKEGFDEVGINVGDIVGTIDGGNVGDLVGKLDDI